MLKLLLQLVVLLLLVLLVLLVLLLLMLDDGLLLAAGAETRLLWREAADGLGRKLQVRGARQELERVLGIVDGQALLVVDAVAMRMVQTHERLEIADGLVIFRVLLAGPCPLDGLLYLVESLV
ncbi:hypothetical protein CH063_11415 [Colletotrichum higginsianum]|uniref:Uncharacterized protein n=1 Tax=Colletotrichum higginsianum (strain IMI 349063) TaxID=759273 RepID=H1VL99_COLHI|nr:hypothetical protein CH063_11415 [Colletotrichum higginsianum]